MLRFLSVWGILVLWSLSLFLSLSLSFSPPLPLGSLSGVGITATGLPLRLGSQSMSFCFVCSAFVFFDRGGGTHSALSSSSFRSVCFSFTVLCGVSLVYSFVSFPGVLSFFPPPEGLLPVIPYSSCRDCRLSLSLALFLVVCKSSVFALALLLSLVIVLYAPGTFFPLWVSFAFSSLVYLASSLRLSFLLSFHSTLTRFLLFGIYSVLFLFYILRFSLRCGCSLRAFPLPFE